MTQPLNLNDIHQYPKFYFAGFWRRFGALLIDVVLLFLLQFALTLGVLKLLPVLKPELAHGSQISILQTFATYMLLVQSLFFLMVCAYFIGAHKKFGRTIGKKLCNITVLRMDGKALSWKDAVLRFSPYLLYLLLTFAIPFVFSNQPIGVSTSTSFSYSTNQGAQKHVVTKPVSPASTARGWLGAAGFLWCLGSGIYLVYQHQRRAPHDLLAGTVVLKA